MFKSLRKTTKRYAAVFISAVMLFQVILPSLNISETVYAQEISQQDATEIIDPIIEKLREAGFDIDEDVVFRALAGMEGGYTLENVLRISEALIWLEVRDQISPDVTDPNDLIAPESVAQILSMLGYYNDTAITESDENDGTPFTKYPVPFTLYNNTESVITAEQGNEYLTVIDLTVSAVPELQDSKLTVSAEYIIDYSGESGSFTVESGSFTLSGASPDNYIGYNIDKAELSHTGSYTVQINYFGHGEDGQLLQFGTISSEPVFVDIIPKKEEEFAGLGIFFESGGIINATAGDTDLRLFTASMTVPGGYIVTGNYRVIFTSAEGSDVIVLSGFINETGVTDISHTIVNVDFTHAGNYRIEADYNVFKDGTFVTAENLVLGSLYLNVLLNVRTAAADAGLFNSDIDFSDINVIKSGSVNGLLSGEVSVSNQFKDVAGITRWEICRSDGSVFAFGESAGSPPSVSVIISGVDIDNVDFSDNGAYTLRIFYSTRTLAEGGGSGDFIEWEAAEAPVELESVNVNVIAFPGITVPDFDRTVIWNAEENILGTGVVLFDNVTFSIPATPQAGYDFTEWASIESYSITDKEGSLIYGKEFAAGEKAANSYTVFYELANLTALQLGEYTLRINYTYGSTAEYIEFTGTLRLGSYEISGEAAAINITVDNENKPISGSGESRVLKAVVNLDFGLILNAQALTAGIAAFGARPAINTDTNISLEWYRGDIHLNSYDVTNLTLADFGITQEQIVDYILTGNKLQGSYNGNPLSLHIPNITTSDAGLYTLRLYMTGVNGEKIEIDSRGSFDLAVLGLGNIDYYEWLVNGGFEARAFNWQPNISQTV